MSDQGRRLQEEPPARHSSALRVRAKVPVSLLGQGHVRGSRSGLQLQQRVGHVWNPVDRENAASHVTDVGTQHMRSVSGWLSETALPSVARCFEEPEHVLVSRSRTSLTPSEEDAFPLQRPGEPARRVC